MTAQRYRDEVLGSTRPHTARICTAYLDQQRKDVMEWPARSPDVSAIEHLWDILHRRVQGRQPPPRDVLTTRQALVEEWQA